MRRRDGPENHPVLLQRFLLAKLRLAIRTAVPLWLTGSLPDGDGTITPAQTSPTRKRPCDSKDPEAILKRCRYSFSERIVWTEPLRGRIDPTDKEKQDALAIGGLRNAADSVSRLHTVAAFGKKLGAGLMDLLRTNTDEHIASGKPDIIVG